MTRRGFVAKSVALPAALNAAALGAQQHASWVLLGTEKGEGIYRARWNGATGELGKPELAITTDSPTYLRMHPSQPVLYCGNEEAEPKAAVSSFHVDRTTAELQLINRRETHGAAPCFVSIERTGQMVFAANYTGGSLTAFHTGPDGGLVQTVGVLRYNQPTHGPVADRQDAAHMHCAVVAPQNDFVVVCDLGDDLILVFPIAPEKNSYIGGPVRVATRPGSGPRHVAFHPNGKWLYCIHELDCTVDLYHWSVAGGQPSLALRDGSIVSTIKPFSTTAGNTAAEVVVSDDGKFLYVCTRGENTITVYVIDGSSGLLTVMQQLSCGGVGPRWIGFDPSRRWLLSTNQGSSTVTVFARSRVTGKLRPRPNQVQVNTPMFALWL